MKDFKDGKEAKDSKDRRQADVTARVWKTPVGKKMPASLSPLAGEKALHKD